MLTFLCLHIFRHQKQQKGLRGGVLKKEVRQACNHSHWHVQTYTSSPFISLWQFSLRAGELVWPAACLMKIYLICQPRSRWPTTSHKQEAFHSLLATMTIAELSRKCWWSWQVVASSESARSTSKSGTGLSPPERCGDNRLGGSTNNKLDLLGRLSEEKERER